MDFRLLGPFEIRHRGRPVTAGPRRQERCLLGLLLLEAGRVVSTDRLTDLLWDGEPPATARGVVHTYVGRLRQSLGDHGLTIVTRHDGYLVEPADHRRDVDEFAEFCRQAGEAPDTAERVRLLDEALALWRGPLLADVAGDRLRERLAPRLHEQWLVAVRRRAEDLLAMGRHERVVTDLLPVADRCPAQERLVALLMTALHRDGRPAEALHRYDVTAKLLRADLGVAPGAELRELRDRIARRDPRLDRPPAPAYAVRVRDQWLPWHVGGHPALEFCNTYAGWRQPHPAGGGEWLRGYPALAAWAEHLDLADPETTTRLLRVARRAPGEAAAVLRRATTLRTFLYACLTDPADEHAFAAVAEFARAAAAASVFVRDASGLGRWVLPAEAGLDLPLHAAANSAAALLADPRRFTVCACPAPRCGWLFLDPSRQRRYCSVATCAH
ncbi:BTAD domain-containing putative transcriptional regulator [Actinoplanes oblitus]|uniref:BTAD domain-containing putative transcriptional regulator n=1 Tax=Actinoplanes oblitus TaxID=3040509 RepID=A0ABY8WR91_9ACTN|nr:BTAD domain-containing putative transcriptional regulator [Actinoplanes oblitus]WIN00375.1 BTAD domain-containing putative transcriptional regulator [Actinoplanes oblitus]